MIIHALWLGSWSRYPWRERWAFRAIGRSWESRSLRSDHPATEALFALRSIAGARRGAGKHWFRLGLRFWFWLWNN